MAIDSVLGSIRWGAKHAAAGLSIGCSTATCALIGCIVRTAARRARSWTSTGACRRLLPTGAPTDPMLAERRCSAIASADGRCAQECSAKLGIASRAVRGTMIAGGTSAFGELDQLTKSDVVCRGSRCPGDRCDQLTHRGGGQRRCIAHALEFGASLRCPGWKTAPRWWAAQLVSMANVGSLRDGPNRVRSYLPS